MKTVQEITDVSNSTDDVVLEKIVSNELEKRPLEESDQDNEGERKKCKINNDENNDLPTISKRALKKLQKQQEWLEKKLQRK